MASCLGSLVDYGSDDESSKDGEDQPKQIVSTEEVYAQDGDEIAVDEPAAKRSRKEEQNGGMDKVVDSFLAEIGEDLQRIPEEQASSVVEKNVVEEPEEEEEDIDGEEIPEEALVHIPTTFESAVIEEPPPAEEIREEEIPSTVNQSTLPEEKPAPIVEPIEVKKEEPDAKLPYFKLANRCANAMKSTLNVRSVQMDEYGGFRVYLRYDDIPICMLSSMGQHESEITARRSAVKDLVEQMLELGLFPPNTKKILAEKITTVDKMVEVTKPVLSYLKFQLSDQRYQRMLRDDSKMSIKADCTQIQLQLIASLIDQIRFFTYRFYAEPTNNPWLHLAPVNSVAPSPYTVQLPSSEFQSSTVKEEPIYGAEPVYGFDYAHSMDPVPYSAVPTGPPSLAEGMKLRIIEDTVSTVPPGGNFFSLPPPTHSLPSTGFQSQFVRTVARITQSTPVKEQAMSAALKIKVEKHDVISEIVEKTIAALGWTERNDTIMVGLIRKRAYLWVDEVPIAILGAMGESEKLSEAVSSCTHELMEQLCAWSLFPLDMVSQICRNKEHLTALLYSMCPAFSFIMTTLREDQYMSLHRTQGMARVPLEAPASHQATAISFRCRVKNYMDKFWETHKIHLGPLIPLPKLEQWEREYFVHTESLPVEQSRNGDEYSLLQSQKSRADLPWTGSGDAPTETEEYL
ncbi:hypothetical protein PFISCL1PPCAC_1940 [Pristionchus fissidentatus]|uniref:Uncharacterized protein n=1 Tax=Pristionchus fissidentatus TaxID=1538716 RepID=A0AAV5UWP5_9BILA|nr:hypothetical protein PFISCL1PPCAC_1940 [Pristionchus fissidentatus]